MIRYKKLGYVALNVSNLSVSKPFYEHIVGCTYVGEVENGPVFFRTSRDHHNVVLYETKGEPGLKRIGFEMEDENQLELAYEHFQKAGLNPSEVDKEELKILKQGKSFRFTEPYTGATMEFYNEMNELPKDHSTIVTKILRLGHVVVRTSNWGEAVKFYKEVMNFRVSDTVAEGIAFMRCFPNPYHHSFGLAKGRRGDFHHVAFMVQDLDDIGIAKNRMHHNNVPIVHGPGRHNPSGSVFLYYLDPDNLSLEYSLGMEEFPEVGARKPRRLEPNKETIDIWGSTPDPRKTAFGKVEILDETVQQPMKV